MRSSTILTIAVVLYVAYMSYFSIARYEHFQTGACDLGIFSQSSYTFAKYGMLFYNNVEGCGISHFGVHFQPIMVLSSLPYFFAPDPRALLVLQSASLALAAVPLYLLAKEFFPEALALTIALSYLLNPAVHGINSFDYHPVSFGPLFLFSAVYALKKRRVKLFWLFTFLFLAVKEDAGAGLAALALFLLCCPYFYDEPLRERLKLALTLFVLGIAWVYVTTKIIIPYFNPAHEYPYWNWSFFDEKVLKYWKAKLLFLGVNYASLAFVPLLCPSTLLASYPLLKFDNLAYFHIGYQYPYYFVAILYLGLIGGILRAKKFLGDLALKLASPITLVAALLALALWDPTGLSVPIVKEAFEKFMPWITSAVAYRTVEPLPHDAFLREVVKAVGNVTEPFCVSKGGLFPFFSTNKYTYPTDDCVFLRRVLLKAPVCVFDATVKGSLNDMPTLAKALRQRYVRRNYVVYSYDGTYILIRKSAIKEYSNLIKKIEEMKRKSAIILFFNNLKLKGRPSGGYAIGPIALDWGKGKPSPYTRRDFFSDAIVGTLRLNETKVLELKAVADDKAVIVIDGKLVLECEGGPCFGRVTLSKGEHLVAIAHFDEKGKASLFVYVKEGSKWVPLRLGNPGKELRKGLEELRALTS